jgi:hypothetical protein
MERKRDRDIERENRERERRKERKRWKEKESFLSFQSSLTVTRFLHFTIFVFLTNI